jgi:hypothetical protein
MILRRANAADFGVAALGLGLIALAGLWLLVSEALLSRDRRHAGGAWLSTTVAGFRGDVWAERLRATQTGNQPADMARRFAVRTVARSPVTPEAWLTLAEAVPEEGAQKQAAIAMACATGPAVVPLMTRRIALAVSANAITDTLVEQCVRSDVRHILHRENGLRAALLEIDRTAPPAGRARLRAIIGDIDPALAASLPSG